MELKAKAMAPPALTTAFTASHGLSGRPVSMLWKPRGVEMCLCDSLVAPPAVESSIAVEDSVEHRSIPFLFRAGFSRAPDTVAPQSHG